MLVFAHPALRDDRCEELGVASIRKKEVVRSPREVRRQSIGAFYRIRRPWAVYAGSQVPTVLHHQLQERATEINRLLQHHVGAISAIKLDLLLDDG